MLPILLISLGLSMDAVSASIAQGLKCKKIRILYGIKMSFLFGLFQGLMPVLGWITGELLKTFISSIDHWFAFILLFFIGVKMIREAFAQKESDVADNKTLFVLAVATSIDAYIVGITLAFFEMPFLLSVVTIGVVTFVLSFLGFIFGRKIGQVFGKKIEVLGGLVLILIGLKILLEHLSVI